MVSVFEVRGGTFRLTGFCDFSFGGLRRPDESSLSPFTNFSTFARLGWGSWITSISGLSSLGCTRFTGLDFTIIISGLGEREGGSSSTVTGEAGREAVWEGDVEVLDDPRGREERGEHVDGFPEAGNAVIQGCET